MSARTFLKRRRNDLFYLLVLGLKGAAVALPRRLGLRLFGALGAGVYRLGGIECRRTREHLRIIYGGEWDEARIRRTARATYVNIAKNLFDAVRLPRLPDDAFMRVVHHDPVEGILDAYGRGRGFILVTSHLGCFEMLLPFFARFGIASIVVGQRLFDPRIDAMVARARSSGPGMDYVPRSESPRSIIRRLKEGRGFGALIDQDTAVDGVFAHFLGRLAYTPSGPIRLAMRYDIPLFVGTITRRDDDSHYVRISPELALRRGGVFEHDLVRNVETANALISDAIRDAPEQWVWMHRRWRRRPHWPSLARVPNIEAVDGRTG